MIPRPRFRSRCAALAVALAVAMASAAVGPVRAQEPPPSIAVGTIRGMVFDSLRGEPLSGATVELSGTLLEAVTDAEGRFALEGVPAGVYDLVFHHEGLEAVGVSSGSQRVTVPPGNVVEVMLATPSWFTLVVSECLFEARKPGTGALAGWVGDGASGVGMPSAKVTLTWWAAGSRDPTIRELEADPSGWYRACDVPGDTPIGIVAHFLNLRGVRQEVSVAPGRVREASFLLWGLDPGGVSGHVLESGSGAAVAGAEVRLRGTSLRAVTGRSGAFRFRDTPPGRYTLTVEHLAYAARQDSLLIPSGRTISVVVPLAARAIELEPLTVTVGAEPPARRAAGGLTVTREQIEKVGHRSRDAAEVLQALSLPGVIVRRRADGTLCVGYAPGQTRLMAFGGCVSMEVYINGVHATSTEMALHIPPESIDRIVLYRPVEAGNLFPVNAANGVLVIYTRR